MSIRKYQTAGTKKAKLPKGSYIIDGVTYRDLNPEVSDAINQVDAVFGGRDVLTGTAIAESTGGHNPKAGQNYFQIMQEGLDAVKDIKSHPALKKKLALAKEKFGIDLSTMSLKDVRTNPVANALVARLYYMNDPNPLPTTQEGIGNIWSSHYNTSADKHGTPEYFNKAVNKFNYKAKPVPEPIVIPEFVPSIQDNTSMPKTGGPMQYQKGNFKHILQQQTKKEIRWPGYNPNMERRLEEHNKILKKRQNPSGGNSPLSYAVNVPMDDDLAKYLIKKNTYEFQNPEKYDPYNPNDPNSISPWQELQMGGSVMSNPSMYQQMQQMKQLPGGTMSPIPGSDAVEFKGQTHKQGGILMDEQTEVEDGETMDKVTMKNGQNEDYFFSSYLKKGGRAYSEMHKEILSRGGNQEEINYLAAMQEKAAKRSPNKIAKLGGVMQYENGGLKRSEIKAFQKELHEEYKEGGGTLSFRKWNKANPFSQEDYDTNYAASNTSDLIDMVAKELEAQETVGLRQELPGAYGYRADAGDGYTICQSGNCQDGTGVMYTYYAENIEELEALQAENPDAVLSKTPDGTVIAMYEGEFKDGKPIGQGKFTWNNVDASLDQGVPFVADQYFSEGEFNVDPTGHPDLQSGTQDWGDLGIKKGVYVNGKLTSGTETKNDKTINYEDGEKTKKFSKDARKNLENLGLLEVIPFKYSQGEINPKYKKMKDYKTYTQPTEKELNDLGYSSHDEFRADYERLIDESYDWKNVDDWGKQHEDALTAIKTAKDFTRTGTYIAPEVVETLDVSTLDPSLGPGAFDETKGSVKICPCAPEYPNYTVPEGVECFNCNNNIESEDGKGGEVDLKLGAQVPWETYLAGAAQLAPAYYALTHKQPDPEMVPFESGVTSPIVPGRLRAEKLSHVNMNLQRSINDSNLREMNQYIDTSGGGPANMINRMAAWGQKHEGDMQIAQAEKQANIGISNQNVAIENQTNLHNLKMEQEAALGNAQMQQAEAQRLNEVNAINTAAKNKVKDDEEYMKYAGIIAGAQGIGSLFGDMLSYKGDRRKALGYSMMGSTERMFLKQNLGGTLYRTDGSIFCESFTEEDIANYYNASKNQQINVLNQDN